jgi:hypothetical protein
MLAASVRQLCLCLLTLAAGDPFAAGLRAYREGRFADALAAFAAAERAAGGQASAELLYDKALAAVQAGRLEEAGAAADAAAARSETFAARRDFLRGAIAFVRADAAARQAGSAESEPFAFDAAKALAEAARDAFARLVLAHPEWHEARRNAERAARLLQQIEERRAAAAANARKPKEQPVQPAPPPESPEAEPAPEELSRDQVRRLFEKLAAKEREKQRLRRSRREAGAAEVQQDW